MVILPLGDHMGSIYVCTHLYDVQIEDDDVQRTIYLGLQDFAPSTPPSPHPHGDGPYDAGNEKRSTVFAISCATS